MRKKSELGLTDEHGYGVRCERCDCPLEWSEWNGQKLVYSINKSMREGFLCIKCAVNPPKISGRNRVKPKVTIDDLDNYLAKLLRLR